MSYIPPNAKWYVAEPIEEITVEGHSENVVHRNLVLVRADSPDEAYDKAMSLGSEGEDAYDNPAGLKVRIRFRGLGMLNVVHDELGHGAELLYHAAVGVSEAEIQSWVPPKEKLGLYRPIGPAARPDYSCGEIMRDVERLLGERNE